MFHLTDEYVRTSTGNKTFGASAAADSPEDAAFFVQLVHKVTRLGLGLHVRLGGGYTCGRGLQGLQGDAWHVSMSHKCETAFLRGQSIKQADRFEISIMIFSHIVIFSILFSCAYQHGLS